MIFGLLYLLEGFFFAGYLAGGNSFPTPLSAEEERKHLQAYVSGNEDAKNVLIERNLRLVAHMAKRYGNHAKDSDDLISVGTIGLIKAISSFKPDKGTRLATYAAKCIDNAMLFCVIHISPFMSPAEKTVVVRSLEEDVNFIPLDDHAFYYSSQ